MSDPQNYSVGWICAITTEYVAALACLDELHEEPADASEHDNNSYTLGRIGKHNVVIAVLPDGEYGTVSAARIARDILHTFPNIRIGLMVGIGGGVPSQNHDIRLGDVVVSSPRDGNGGVFQHDFGKTIQDQSFRDTKFLNQPPEILRGAVSKLRVRYEENGNQIEETINSILEKKPRLMEKYKRPDPNSDRLYKAEYTHPLGNEASCIEVCSDDPSDLIRRKRMKMQDNTTIHYGLIASGNQLIRNARMRDILAKEKGVLCFEMEAAGLMNHFPCLVIRGVSDYSDSHKNKEWQGYTAMAASVYAKNLLCRIVPNKVEAEKKFADILASVEKDVNKIGHDVQDVKNDVKDLGLEQRRDKIVRWLSPSDPSTNYNKALERRYIMVQDIGFYKILHSKTRQKSFLWLYGIPGCCKTILSSTIIDDLQKTRPVLYFYFDFNDAGKQTFDDMVRSLIYQLYCNFKDTRKQLHALFSSCKDGQCQPGRESLCNVFLQITEQVKEVWIVLDALGECPTRAGPPAEGLLSWIGDLLNSQRNVHLLATSRLEQDIKSKLSNLALSEDIIHIQGDGVTDDIHAYVHSKIKDSEGLIRWQGKPEIQDEIEIKLMEKANGMFRWAACQLDSLERCLNYRDLQEALNSLPVTLDETYEEILNRIPNEYMPYSKRILQFLTFSERPLRIEEAIDAIAVDTKGDQYFDPKYRMPNPQEILCYCSSLVIMVPAGSHTELQLAHFSVKEYLTSTRVESIMAIDFQETIARGLIAEVCLAYLFHLNVELPKEVILERFPFAHYCARYWADHARASNKQNKRLLDFINKFFCNYEKSYNNCYNLYCPDFLWKNGFLESQKYGKALPCYFASLGGFIDAITCLLSQGADVNAEGGEYGTALCAASAKGHKKIVDLLLEKGANVNAEGKGYHGTALGAASAHGHKEIVELLLEEGANINAEGGKYGTALCAGGYKEIVKLIHKESMEAV